MQCNVPQKSVPAGNVEIPTVLLIYDFGDKIVLSENYHFQMLSGVEATVIE